MIAQRAASTHDGLAQRDAQCVRESCNVCGVDALCRTQRRDSGQEERFVRVDVAHAGNGTLVKQNRLDCAGSAHDACELSRRNAQRIDP